MAASGRVATCEDLAADRLARAMAAELDAEIFIKHLKSTDGSDIIERSAYVCESCFSATFRGVGIRLAALFSLSGLVAHYKTINSVFNFFRKNVSARPLPNPSNRRLPSMAFS